jgi:two-component system, NarL family, sensor kinase
VTHKSISDTEKLQRRNRELSILNTVAEALNREIDLERALQTTLAHAAELLSLHTGWVFLIDEDTEKFYPAAAQGLPPALAEHPRRLGGTCYCIDSYVEGDLEGAANVNVISCSRLRDLVNGTDGLRYHASIPLYAHGKKMGILNVAASQWRELSPEDLKLLYTIGDLLSIAIERARLFERSVQFGATEERNRLAREIHDTLAQGLTAISLQLEAADALLDRDAHRTREAILKALDLTRANLEEARRSVMDLRAAPLDGKSLREALAALVGQMSRDHKHKVEFEVIGPADKLPIRVESCLYRVAQEALNNATRHAKARHISLQLIAATDQLQLIIEDDGQGFDPAHIPPGHYGLVGLNERVKLMGGKLHIKSAPDSGTRIEVALPL